MLTYLFEFQTLFAAEFRETVYVASFDESNFNRRSWKTLLPYFLETSRMGTRNEERKKNLRIPKRLEKQIYLSFTSQINTASLCPVYLFELGEPFQDNLVVLIEVTFGHLVLRIWKQENSLIPWRENPEHRVLWDTSVFEAPNRNRKRGQRLMFTNHAKKSTDASSWSLRGSYPPNRELRTRCHRCLQKNTSVIVLNKFIPAADRRPWLFETPLLPVSARYSWTGTSISRRHSTISRRRIAMLRPELLL